MDPRARPGLQAQRPSPDPAPTGALGDLRFRSLVSSDEWGRLPVSVRRRFSKRLGGGATTVYVGEVTACEAGRVGRLLANAARLIGAPLPLVWATPAPSVVTVTEEDARAGQVWTRLYARRGGFPQVIHSAKRFAGPTGLEEHVGGGIGMALRVSVESGALVFRSDHYFVRGLGRRWRLPAWCEPGRLSVVHAELGEGRFSFTLELVHPALGRLIRQHAVFREEAP
jgi:hypothetical protein